MPGGPELLAAAKHAYIGAAMTAFTASAGLTLLTAVIAVTMFAARKSHD
jgi:hypothetical protein